MKMKNVQTFLCFLIIGMYSMINSQSVLAQVNGKNVMSVTTTNNLTFTSVGDKKWAELSVDGKPSFYFNETGRDQWSVYLQQVDYAPKKLALDLWQKKVKVNGSPLYDISSSSMESSKSNSNTIGNSTNVSSTENLTTSTPSTDNTSVNTNSVSNADAINEYIWDLQYNPREILSINMDLETQGKNDSDAEDSRDDSNNAVIICKKEKIGYSDNLQEITLLNPSVGVIYPGALIKADASMAAGVPTIVSLARGDIKITADLAGNNKVETIERVTATKYESKKNILLEEWNKIESSKGYTNTAKSFLKRETGSSLVEIAAGLDVAATFDGGGASAAIDTEYSSNKEYLVAIYKQVYYTVFADHPEKPSDLFDKSVTLRDIQRVFPANGNKTKQPPGFIRSVDYGRMIVVRMESEKQDFKLDMEASFEYAAAGQSIDAAANAKIKTTLKNSKFIVYTLGGNSQSASTINGTDTKQLFEVIEQGATYNRKNPGVPLSYTVDFVKDNANAQIRNTGEYITEDCQTYNNGFIELYIDGAFGNAYFQVKANVPEDYVDHRNNPPIDWSKGYNSGRQGNQWRKKIWLPGDAKNIQIITGRNDYVIYDEILPGPTNLLYKIHGTIFGQGFVEIDPKTMRDIRVMK